LCLRFNQLHKPQITSTASRTAALTCINLSLSALAQTTQSIEEIIVRGQQVEYYKKNATTALKQDVPLRETPASVFIINSELIADQQPFRLITTSDGKKLRLNLSQASVNVMGKPNS